MRAELAQAIELLRSDTPEDVERALGMLRQTVFSFAMKLCGSGEAAEHVTKSVLHRGLRRLADNEDASALAVWIYRVTCNRCWLVRQKGAGERPVRLDNLLPGWSELGLLAADSHPEKMVLSPEQQRLLEEAVLRLPARLRIALVLHDMEELSTEEVAQVIGCQPRIVRGRLNRGRWMLRKDFSSLVQSRLQIERPVTKPVRRPEKRPAACGEFLRQASEYVDGRLEPPGGERMREHLAACPDCQAFQGDLRASIERCRMLQVQGPESARERIRVLTRQYRRHRAAAGERKTPLAETAG
ncbi:MAG TPA: sigma-70 family RNA polymerase sigma factor [Terracidiphilus sp.]|nr:sigma-70 family RNA polymerase sigma factor [Terracidiphilus sp.]